LNYRHPLIVSSISLQNSAQYAKFLENWALTKLNLNDHENATKLAWTSLSITIPIYGATHTVTSLTAERLATLHFSIVTTAVKIIIISSIDAPVLNPVLSTGSLGTDRLPDPSYNTTHKAIEIHHSIKPIHCMKLFSLSDILAHTSQDEELSSFLDMRYFVS